MSKTDDVLTSEIETVAGGLANVGILKHTFGSAASGTAFTIIEKRMQRRKAFQPEYEICKQLSALTDAGIHMSPMPNVYSAGKADDYYYVMMPFFKGVNLRLKDRNAHAKLVAKSVADLNACALEVPDTNRMTLLIGTNGNGPRPTEAYGTYLDAVIDLCNAPIPSAYQSPPVKSHNDLFFPNIATEAYGDGYNVVFIDFGHVSYNEVGAEFHHFIRTLQSDPKKAESTEILIDEYVRLTGANKKTVLLNAHKFALLRLAERLRSAHKAGKTERFNIELDIGWQLLETAKTLLAQMQTPARKSQKSKG